MTIRLSLHKSRSMSDLAMLLAVAAPDLCRGEAGSYPAWPESIHSSRAARELGASVYRCSNLHGFTKPTTLPLKISKVHLQTVC